MEGLMETDIVIPETKRPAAIINPLVTIENRHRRVKERRALREQAQRDAMKEKKIREELKRRAKETIKREEEERARKERQEEEAIKVHVVAIKRQMNQQKERERTIRAHLLKLEEGERQLETITAPVPVTVVGKKMNDKKQSIVKPEEEQHLNEVELTKEEKLKKRKRRDALLKNRLDGFQAKKRKKILRQLFIAWYDTVTGYNMILRKATLVKDWRLLLKSWRTWVRVVKANKNKLMMLKAAEELREENRKVMLARNHCNSKLMRRCVQSWWASTVSARLHATSANTERRHIVNVREKVMEFLSTQSQQEREQDGQQHGDTRGTSHGMRDGRGTTGVAHTHGTNEAIGTPLNKQVSNEEKVKESSRDSSGTTHENGDSEKKEIAIQTANVGVATQGVWLKAKSHVESILSKGVQEMANTQQNNDQGNSHPSSTPTTNPHHDLPNLTLARSLTMERTAREMLMAKPSPSNHDTVVFRPVIKNRKPCTKPMDPKGMKERAVLIADRKKAREERKQRREQELKEKLAKEEENKRLEEKERKEAEIRRRKEEKRIAKEKEIQKQHLLQHMRDQRNRADDCYSHSLKQRAFIPWRDFTRSMKESVVMATDRHSLSITRRVWRAWSLEHQRRITERNRRADEFHRLAVLADSIKQWKEFVRRERELLDYYRSIFNNRLLQKLFHVWERLTESERRETWNKDRKAHAHRHRKLLEIYFRCWKRFVPFAHKEKERRERIAEMYKKVKELLPDFDPSSSSDSDY